MAQLEVHVVTADGVIWEGNATSLTVTAHDGEVGILPGHAPLLAVLAEGSLRIVSAAGAKWSTVLTGGFISVDGDKIAIVADGVKDPVDDMVTDGYTR